MSRPVIVTSCAWMLLLASCTDSPCPEGTREEGAACVAVDASADTDSPDVFDAGPEPMDATPDVYDGGPDAGPCGECDSETPLCNETTMACVQCLVPTDCGVGGTAMCSPDGACVECLGNADCEEPDASVCSTAGDTAGSCVACTAGSATDCAGVVDGLTPLNVCDDSGDAPECVECNAANDESACGANVCDVLAQTCTEIPANDADPCDLCVSDRQCDGDAVCAQESFEGAPTDFRCAYTRPEVMDQNCLNVAPYIDANADVVTIGGPLVEVCQLATTTCASLQHYRNEDCMTLDAEGDARCGLPGVADGYCRQFMGAANRCTYGCIGNDDCLGALTCATGQVPPVCRLEL